MRRRPWRSGRRPFTRPLRGDSRTSGLHRGRVGFGQPPRLVGAYADAVLAQFAARQYGVVARRQAIGGGVPSHVIDHRVRQGRLKVLHPGIYRLGPIAGAREREMAALLACGDGAVLSGGSAAAVWHLLPPSLNPVPVDVIIRSGRRVRVSGVCAHRAILAGGEATHHVGIPITTPARTLLDLAGRIGVRELERAFEHDRGRDARLAAAGLRVMRVTWRQLSDRPEMLLVRVAQALVRTSGQ